METVELVEHHHVERSRGRPFLLEAMDMEVGVVRAPVGEPVNQLRIAVEGENHRATKREQPVEITVAPPMRVNAVGLERHQIDNVDDPHPEARDMVAQQTGGRDRLKRRHVAGAGQNHIRLVAILAGAGPIPDTAARGAMRFGFGRRQPLRRGLLAGDDQVHAIIGAQTMIADPE